VFILVFPCTHYSPVSMTIAVASTAEHSYLVGSESSEVTDIDRLQQVMICLTLQPTHNDAAGLACLANCCTHLCQLLKGRSGCVYLTLCRKNGPFFNHLTWSCFADYCMWPDRSRGGRQYQPRFS
jgi:hypothetical protein